MSFFSDDYVVGKSGAVPAVNMQSVMRMVYVWMMMGLGISALVAWFVASNESMWPIVYNPATMIISFIGIIGIAIAIPFGMKRRWLNPTAAIVIFMVFAGLMGLTLSSVFLVYELGTIWSALLTTTALFATMSVFGFTTKMDLMKWGTYLFIGMIGLLVVSVINWFLGSDGLTWLISLFGVVLFTAMTAYDTQKIKRMAESFEVQNDNNLAIKVSVYGALELYLDFINLFLYLLRLFGSSRD